jgi:hypothetical protein
LWKWKEWCGVGGEERKSFAGTGLRYWWFVFWKERVFESVGRQDAVVEVLRRSSSDRLRMTNPGKRQTERKSGFHRRVSRGAAEVTERN